ncbi:hypothetical protein KCP71_09115 [Salmonella enterica subsp. enterica]|nr:hypothetical protein KCP71_09115 [Salmonella enterica subsp. enterica]
MVYGKYPENPRHIEIQVLADGRSNRYLSGGTRPFHASVATRKWLKKPRAALRRNCVVIGERCAKACVDIGYRGRRDVRIRSKNGEFYFIRNEHPWLNTR